MSEKVRLGFIGANVKSRWGIEGHFPAIKASSDVELTAVCTTRPESAEEARRFFNAKLAFSDYREMVRSPEIDAVVVCVRIPSHHALTIAALDAGKHVYTEWPLGRTTAEAEEMTSLARARGLVTAVGLQSRVNPVLCHMKALIESGYIGEVLACHVVTVRGGPLQVHSSRSYMADVTHGATPLTKQSGHVIDALRFVAGDFVRLGCMITTQAKQWMESDTGKTVDVTAPDTILLSGQLASGAAASVHVGPVPWAAPGYRMDIFGKEGSLIVTGSESSQRHELRLQGAQRSQTLVDIEVPVERYSFVPRDFPRGTPFHVGQMYSLFAQAIQTGKTPLQLPTFETALQMHQLIDNMRLASEMGKVITIAPARNAGR